MEIRRLLFRLLKQNALHLAQPPPQGSIAALLQRHQAQAGKARRFSKMRSCQAVYHKNPTEKLKLNVLNDNKMECLWIMALLTQH